MMKEWKEMIEGCVSSLNVRTIFISFQLVAEASMSQAVRASEASLQ